MFKRLTDAVYAVGQGGRSVLLDAAAAVGSATPDAPARPQRLWATFAIILPLAAAVAFVMPRFTWVVTDSIDAYAVRADPGPIARGDLASFTLRHWIAGPKPLKATKVVLCVPGDRLTMSVSRNAFLPGARDAAFYCNGKFLNVSKPVAKDGRRVHYWVWTDAVVPPGKYFVGSDHPDGFDSRYLGLIDEANLTRAKRVL